jgi:hypothetical protein
MTSKVKSSLIRRTIDWDTDYRHRAERKVIQDLYQKRYHR